VVVLGVLGFVLDRLVVLVTNLSVFWETYCRPTPQTHIPLAADPYLRPSAR
jgi:hypothetical protein